jgi:hypothetical protein
MEKGNPAGLRKKDQGQTNASGRLSRPTHMNSHYNLKNPLVT